MTILTIWGEIDLYNVHITPFYSSARLPDGRPYHQIKLELLAGVYQTLSSSTSRLRILCGDFNTPQEEKTDGEVITWGYRKKHGRYVITPSFQSQHEVEFQILRGLGENYDLPDVYRQLHGYESSGAEQAFSYIGWGDTKGQIPLRSCFCLKGIGRKECRISASISR